MLAPSSALDRTLGCIEGPLVATIHVAAARSARHRRPRGAGRDLRRQAAPLATGRPGPSGTVSGSSRNAVRVLTGIASECGRKTHLDVIDGYADAKEGRLR